MVFLKSVNYDEFKGGDSPEKHRAIKMEPFDSETEIEFREASKISQFEIKTEPEEFFNDAMETEEIFDNDESIEVKDEFILAMKDFVSDNVPPKNIEQQIADTHEKRYHSSYQPETLQDELSNAMKDFQFEPNMTFKEAGQLEIKNKPEEFPNNDQKEALEIETIERKDENSFEMEAQEDFELQLESDSDDDMNDNEIEPPTMDIKDDGATFIPSLTSIGLSMEVSIDRAQLSQNLNKSLDDLDFTKFLQDHALNHRLTPCDQTDNIIWCFVNVTVQAVMKTPSFYNVMKTLPYAGMKKNFMLKVYKMVTDFMTEFSPFEKKKNENNLSVEFYSSIFTKNMDLPMGMTYEARSFFQFLLNLTFLLNEVNVEMLTNLKPVVSEYEVLEENNFGHNNPNEDLQGEGSLGCIFQGQLQSRDKTESTLIVQPFFTLSLDIKSKNINNLTEAMLHYFVLDKNDGHFEELPTVLTIHLKRFIYDESAGCQKLLKDIEFPEDLKIPWEFLSHVNKYGGKQPTYRLFGIVYHSGEDVSDGHYVTAFNHPSLGWLNCDKGVMSSMPQRLRNSVPYILFYQNIDTLFHDPNSPTLKSQD